MAGSSAKSQVVCVITEMLQTGMIGFRACSFVYPHDADRAKDRDDAIEAFDTFYRAISRLSVFAKKKEGQRAPPPEHPILRKEIVDAEVPQVYCCLVSFWNGRRPLRNKLSFIHKHLQELSERYMEAVKGETWPGDVPVPEKQPGDQASEAADSSSDEKAADAPRSQQPNGYIHDVRVEVLSCKELGSPDYRFGDITKSLMSGKKNKIEKVYVKLKLGAKDVKQTAFVDCPEKCKHPTVEFHGDRHFYKYRGARDLMVSVYDHREVQAAVRGDPGIGKGMLSLDEAAVSDCASRTEEVPLKNGDAHAGIVVVRYQFLRPQTVDEFLVM